MIGRVAGSSAKRVSIINVEIIDAANAFSKKALNNVVPRASLTSILLWNMLGIKISISMQ